MKTNLILKTISMTIADLASKLEFSELESMTKGDKVVIAVSVAQSKTESEVIRGDLASTYVKGVRALKDTFKKNAKIAEEHQTLMLELQLIEAEIAVN